MVMESGKLSVAASLPNMAASHSPNLAFSSPNLRYHWSASVRKTPPRYAMTRPARVAEAW